MYNRLSSVDFILYLLFIPCFLIGWLLCELNNSFKFYEISFYIFYLLLIIKTIKRCGVFSLYNLFLILNVFFVYNCFLIDFFGFHDFYNISFPVGHIFPKEVAILFLHISALSSIIIDYCFYRFYGFYIKIPNYDVANKSRVKKIAFFLLMVSTPLFLIKLYIQLQYIKQNGYLALWTGMDISYPLYLRGVGTLVLISYYLIMSTTPSKKEFIFANLIMLIVSFSDSLKGVRTIFLLQVMILFIYFQNIYKIRITLRKLIALFTLCVCFAIFMGARRASYGESSKVSKSFQPIKIVQQLFLDQTSTRAVPMTCIEYGANLREYPFIFYPILQYLPNSLYNAKENSIGYQTVAVYSKASAENGLGLGGSWLAEFYDCGKILGVIFLSICLALFLQDITCKLTCSGFIFPLIYLMVKSILFSPRNIIFSFMIALPDYFRFILFYLFLDFFCKFINSSKKKKSKSGLT